MTTLRIPGILIAAALLCGSATAAERAATPAAVPADDLLARGNALYAKGEFAKALILYRRAEERGSDRAASAFNQGNCLFQLNRLPEAAASYRKAVRYAGGTLPPAQANLAAVLFRMEQYGEAVAAYRRVVRDDPDNAGAWLYLADAHARLRDYAGALRALEKARALEPGDVSIVYQQAETHAALKEYDAAVDLVREAYALKPAEVDFLFYIGDLRRTQGRFGDAASAYREGLAQRPDDADGLYKLADALARDGKPYLAMDPLQRALAIKPDYTDAAVFLGNLAFDAKWWERSEDAYRQAVEHGNREGLEGLFNLADALYRQGRAEAAADLLRRALPLAPKDAELQAEEARYRDLAGKTGQAGRAGQTDSAAGRPSPGN